MSIAGIARIKILEHLPRIQRKPGFKYERGQKYE
jgi:hypothetical protein